MKFQHQLSLCILCLLMISGDTFAQTIKQKPLTTLTNGSKEFTISKKPYVILSRGDTEAVIVNNEAVDDEVLPKHRAKYSGVAKLTHKNRKESLFVPSYAGLNYEHIHDGTVQERDVLFEPRNAPMELRIIDKFTVDLYQAPSPHYELESCLRYHMLEDGTLEMTLECIPRKKSFQNNYIGLFWASYIHQPESLDIHFRGRAANSKQASRWIRGVTPSHGVLSTHVSSEDNREFKHDPDFPLTLVFNRSKYEYAAPWYYGVSHGMAFVQMFRQEDEVRISQSPSGGGKGNPAWDFQYLINNYQVDQCYQKVMRAMYVPYESQAQIKRVTRENRKALGENL